LRPLQKEVILETHANGGGEQMKFSTVFGYFVMAAAIAGVIVSLPDIKRYIKISTM
jgi:hypothetical protein